MPSTGWSCPTPPVMAARTGVAGGSAVVAFADTEHPEAVAKLMEFLIQAENYGAFSAGTLSLPAQKDVASQGVDFETDDASVLAALAAYTAEVPKLQDQAVAPQRPSLRLCLLSQQRQPHRPVPDRRADAGRGPATPPAGHRRRHRRGDGCQAGRGSRPGSCRDCASPTMPTATKRT